jgi:phosphoribosylanthranilate isomerase
MTWVKICGMTNLEDALVAVDAGADAVGFVFYEKSPRNVSVETAREIVKKLPQSVEKVGVFVGAAAETINAINEAGLTAAQLYIGNEEQALTLDDDILQQLPCRVIVAISLALLSEDRLCGFHVSKKVNDRILGLLIDSGNSQRPGGTGERFDWASLQNMVPLMDRAGLRLVVAGGLKPENVGQAMATLKPWGVDVASGVEAHPGKKDPTKVRAFVRAVREADKKAS